MPLPDIVLRFRRSGWFRVLYVAILAMLLSVLLLVPPLSLLLVPATLLVIPYWLRERGYRRYIVNGLVALLGGMLILAASSAATITSRTTPPLLEGGAPGVALTNGTVEPFRGSAGQEFTFSVDLRTSSPVAPRDVRVWLNLSFFDASLRPARVEPAPQLVPRDASDANFTDGKRYLVRTSLQDYVYFFSFSALVNVSGSNAIFAETFADAGPLVAGFTGYFAVLVLLAGQFAIYPGIFYFFGLGMYWLYRRSQRRRRAGAAQPVEAAATEEGGGYTCTSCGADVPEDATRCPSCGAVFDAEPEMPPAERAGASKEGRDQGR